MEVDEVRGLEKKLNLGSVRSVERSIRSCQSGKVVINLVALF